MMFLTDAQAWVLLAFRNASYIDSAASLGQHMMERAEAKARRGPHPLQSQGLGRIGARRAVA